MNIKLTLSYDGTSYLGWQASGNFPSIEKTLQKILEKILQNETRLKAASRTDAGVHAEGQIVNFSLKKTWDLERLHKSLNQLLPRDIRITALEAALDDFDPTLDAQSKEYHYFLSTAKVQLPFERLFCWHYPFQLDIKEMKAACPFFLGEHDFQAFSNATPKNPKKTLCNLYRLDLAFEKKDEGGRLRFEIHGDRFLYKMVRNLVGTLVSIGAGTLSLEDAKTLMQRKERRLAGVTAPPHGLLLKKVFYSYET